MVFTHEDSPTEEIWFSSVRELADKHGIPWRTTDINAAGEHRPAQGDRPEVHLLLLLPEHDQAGGAGDPERGALNLHGSYLPRYRGRVPVNWAVINGESETGATLHYMVEKPDAGDIVDQEKVAIAFHRHRPRSSSTR